MTDETTPVPEPGEAGREDDDIHYYEVDETNVSESEDEPAEEEEPPAE